MTPPAVRDPSVSRRRFLGGATGLAVTRALATDVASAPKLTVMTRNLYVGVDLFELFEARSMADLRRIAGRLIVEAEAHLYAARVEAIAGEIEATRPDVVGVQEAGLIRTRRPDGEEGSNEWEEVVDLLDLLVATFDARGLGYEVEATTITTDIATPADVDGDRAAVRLTDRTALLVREGVEPVDARTGTFEAAYSMSMGGVEAALDRGYCAVDVTVDDRDLTVATTHLESVDGTTRHQQARELLEKVPTNRPVVLAADLNSGPGAESDAYDLLTEEFDDVHATRQDTDGATCCHAADLRNDSAELSRRIDVVLYRGELEPTAVERVGAAPSDRVVAEVEGETVEVWPSDHAGVVATVEVTAPPTDTQAESVTEQGATPRQGPSTETWFGYGSLATVVALFVAGLTRRRWMN